MPILVRESSGTPAKLTGVYGVQSPTALVAAPAQKMRRSSFLPQKATLGIGSFHRWSRVFLLLSLVSCSEFGVEKTVDVEGMSADAFKSQLDAVMKGS